MVESRDITEYKFYIGDCSGVNVFVFLNELIRDSEDNIDIRDLSDERKNEIHEIFNRFNRKRQNRISGLNKWAFNREELETEIEFEISLNEYYQLIAIKDERGKEFNDRQERLKNSIVTSRSIDNDTFLKYLLQSLNIRNGKDTKKENLIDLTEICKNFGIKDYSKLNKQELIEHLILNLSDEEKIDFLLEYETQIVDYEMKAALSILRKEYLAKETLKGIKIVNLNMHEIDLEFKGERWTTDSFISITRENISNPDRDCSCNIGINEGFCRHFWIGFFKSLKENFFIIEDWRLTCIPKNFLEICQVFYSLLENNKIQ